MDNKVKSKANSKQEIKRELIQERKKMASTCLNLECENEQLKILIDKLNNLASKRENLLLDTKGQKQNLEEADQIFKKSNISEELKIARENSKKLEKTISRLKNKINTIDQELSL